MFVNTYISLSINIYPSHDSPQSGGVYKTEQVRQVMICSHDGEHTMALRHAVTWGASSKSLVAATPLSGYDVVGKAAREDAVAAAVSGCVGGCVAVEGAGVVSAPPVGTAWLTAATPQQSPADQTLAPPEAECDGRLCGDRNMAANTPSGPACCAARNSLDTVKLS